MTVRMEASTKNVEAIERFKPLVEQHYRKPVMDYAKELLPGVESESSSDEEDQNIITEWLKMIVINVCNSNKVAFLIIDIMCHLIFVSCEFRGV